MVDQSIYWYFHFAAIYLTLYPGLGRFKGILGWQSSEQTIRSLEESRALIAAAKKNKQLVHYSKNWTTLKLTTVKLSNECLIKTAPLTYAKSQISLPIVML